MLMQGRNVLSSVNMEVAKLLGIVKENRQKHIDAHIQSVIDWEILIKDVAAQNIKIAKKNAKLLADDVNTKEIQSFKGLPQKPVSYEDSYDKAIRMLDLSSDTNIEIDSDVFNQLVLDEWSFKQSFEAMSTMYAAGASTIRSKGQR